MEGYTLEKRIAVGGTAEIWLARHHERGRVVIKKAIGSFSLEREQEALAKIRSPHVIRLLASGADQLVLEWIDGLDLAALASHFQRRGESLPLGAALTLLDGICVGLDAIHRAGWVHSDLSPANVMIGRDGSIKLIDLGQVRRPHDPPRAEGTPAYQAPEQLRIEPIDVRADLFALGLIAYELLTGVAARPAGMLGAVELLEARMKKPAPPSAVRPGLPPAIDRAILQLLEPDPKQRPSGAGAWSKALAPARDPLALRQAVQRASGPMIPVASTEAAPKPEVVADTVVLPARPAPRNRWMVPLVIAAFAMIALVVWTRPEPEQVVALPDAAIAVVTPTVTVRSIEVEPIEPIEHAIQVLDAGHKKRRTRAHVRISGAVQISGGGMDGPAPRTSLPLEEGATLIQLVSGDMRVLLRVERKKESIDVTIGAPPSSWYQVDCGGAKGSTPLIAIPLTRAISCEASRPDGARAMFSLEKVML